MTIPPSDYTPIFSIVIPTYNRASTIARAIKSCLNQTIREIEIIVVDSGSTDETRAVVNSLCDPRIHFVKEDFPRGVCPARNLGADHSRADWIVFLDSDDELLPDALELFNDLITVYGNQVALIRAACRWDSGKITPNPSFDRKLLDYRGYLDFLEATIAGTSESVPCVKRSTFLKVRFPESRAFEQNYHLNFAKNYSQLFTAKIARLYHSDAPDQNTFVPNVSRAIKIAPEVTQELKRLLLEHGPTLHSNAPLAYAAFNQYSAFYNFLLGRRSEALSHSVFALKLRPFSKTIWATLLLGIISGKLLAEVHAISQRLTPRG